MRFLLTHTNDGEPIEIDVAGSMVQFWIRSPRTVDEAHKRGMGIMPYQIEGPRKLLLEVPLRRFLAVAAEIEQRDQRKEKDERRD